MIIEKLFSMTHETLETCVKEARLQVATGAVCVLQEHSNHKEPFSLCVFQPVHRQADFDGGYYKHRDTVVYRPITEADAYSAIADHLKSGDTIQFSYNADLQRLRVQRFLPATPGEEVDKVCLDPSR